MTTSQSGSMVPKNPVVWWRESYQRDIDEFERAHGRTPESLHELSRWLPPLPIRAEAAPRSEPN